MGWLCRASGVIRKGTEMPSRACGVDCRPPSVLCREGGAVCRSSGAVCKVADVLCKARVMRCKASDTLCKKATTVCKEHDILRKGVAKLCRHPALRCQPREFACSPTAKVSFPCPVPRAPSPVPRAPCPVPRAPAGGSDSCRSMSRKRSCEFLNLPVSILNPHHASTKNFRPRAATAGLAHPSDAAARSRGRWFSEDGIPGLRVDCKASGPLSASYFTNFSSVSVLRKATSAFLSSLLSRMPVGGCLARLGSSVGLRRRL